MDDIEKQPQWIDTTFITSRHIQKLQIATPRPI